MLDCTLSPYHYLYKGKKYKPEKIIGVQNNEQITFIIETEDIPNITFYACELANTNPKDVQSKSNVGNWFKENWWVLLVGVVIILFVVFKNKYMANNSIINDQKLILVILIGGNWK